MATTIYQTCTKCKKETNFKQVGSFKLECFECGSIHRIQATPSTFKLAPPVKEDIIIPGKKDMSFKHAEDIFDVLNNFKEPEKKIEKEVKKEARNFIGEIQGRNVIPTPIEERTIKLKDE